MGMIFILAKSYFVVLNLCPLFIVVHLLYIISLGWNLFYLIVSFYFDGLFHLSQCMVIL